MRTRAVFRIRTGDTCLEGRNVTTTPIRLKRDHEPVLSPCELARQDGGPYKTYYCCTDLIELPVGLEPTKGFPSSFADCFLCRSDSWQRKLLNITIFNGDVPPAMLSLVLPAGVEPTTSRFVVWCSNPLSYESMVPSR